MGNINESKIASRESGDAARPKSTTKAVTLTALLLLPLVAFLLTSQRSSASVAPIAAIELTTVPPSFLHDQRIHNEEMFADICREQFGALNWSAGDVVLPFATFPVEELLCMKGRQLYRPLRDTSRLIKTVFSNTTLQSKALSELVAETDPAHVRWHPSVALLSFPIYHLHHAWYDVAVPGMAFMQQYQGGALLNLPREVVSVHLAGSPFSPGISAAVRLATEGLSSGGSYRDVSADTHAPLDESVDDPRLLHCYCRSLLLTYKWFEQPEHTEVRENASRALTAAVYATQGLPPHQEAGHAADVTLTTVAASLWGINATSSRAQPNMLFLLRNKRRIGKVSKIIAAARLIGFRVLVMAPQNYALQEQLHAARFADVVAGMHGQGLSWMIAMDARQRPFCRRVLELRHYGRIFSESHQISLARDCRLKYDAVSPIHVTFDPHYVRDPQVEMEKLMSQRYPYNLQGFSHQTAYYSLKQDVVPMLKRNYREMVHCLKLNVTESRRSSNG